MLTEEEIIEWGVSISEASTAQLFEQLTISDMFDHSDYNEPEFGLFQSRRAPEPRRVELRFSSSMNEASRIDGYIWVEMYDKKDCLAGQRIAPLPLMGVGTQASTARMVFDCRGDAYSLKYHPIALRTLESVDNPSALSAIVKEDLPESQQKHAFTADWEENVKAFRGAQKVIDKAYHKKVRKWIFRNLIAVCILALLGFLFVQMTH